MNTIDINTPIKFKNFIEKNSNDVINNSNPLDVQQNFLTLLIAQIQNQDPTNPIKNTELTSQLAQINTASGIERLNNIVRQFAVHINKNQISQLSSLIGRHVMIPSNEIVHTKGTVTKFGVELIGDATSIEVKILDNNKKVVYFNKEIKNRKAGIYSLFWDGKDLNDKVMKSGKYNIIITAKNKDQDVPVESLSESSVHSVINSPDEPILDLGPAGKTKLINVLEIF